MCRLTFLYKTITSKTCSTNLKSSFNTFLHLRCLFRTRYQNYPSLIENRRKPITNSAKFTNGLPPNFSHPSHLCIFNYITFHGQCRRGSCTISINPSTTHPPPPTVRSFLSRITSSKPGGFRRDVSVTETHWCRGAAVQSLFNCLGKITERGEERLHCVVWYMKPQRRFGLYFGDGRSRMGMVAMKRDWLVLLETILVEMVLAPLESVRCRWKS